VLGVAAAAASATCIQFWFGGQAKSSHFRRRQYFSLVATFAEALSSFSWAGAGAPVPASTWLAVIQGLFAVAIVADAGSSVRQGVLRAVLAGRSNTAPNTSRSFRLDDRPS